MTLDKISQDYSNFCFVSDLLLSFFEFSDFLHEDFRKIGNCLTSETRSFFDLGNQVGKKIENEKTKRRTFCFFSVMKRNLI